MATLEDELGRLETLVSEAQRSAKALAAALAKIKVAAQTGAIADIEKGLAAIEKRGQEAAASASELSSAWTFDARAYLSNGFIEELQTATTAAGIDLVERDGRLSLFPVLLKVEPREPAIRIGKRLERRIRPAALARILADIQRRPQRFNEQRFLELLYRAYRYLCGADWNGAGRGPVKALAELHAVMTLLPDSDYSVQEFGRDLLLLDRRPELRARDGARLVFEASAIARTSAARINVYDEKGLQKVYIALRFAREE